MHHPLAVGIEHPQFAEPIKVMSKFLIFPPVELRPFKPIGGNKHFSGEPKQTETRRQCAVFQQELEEFFSLNHLGCVRLCKVDSMTRRAEQRKLDKSKSEQRQLSRCSLVFSKSGRSIDPQRGASPSIDSTRRLGGRPFPRSRVLTRLALAAFRIKSFVANSNV